MQRPSPTRASTTTCLLVGALLAVGGLAGCAPTAAPSPPEATVAPAAAGDGLPSRDEGGRQADPAARPHPESVSNRELLDELRRRNLDARETARGVVVNLPDVLFEFDRADLTRDARRTVRDIADVLTRSARGRQVSIEGHTDSVGSEAYNQHLSQTRAESVADALVNGGVNRRRVRAHGFGKSRPIAPNTSHGHDDPVGRAKNRRVEVVIENPRRPGPDEHRRGS